MDIPGIPGFPLSPLGPGNPLYPAGISHLFLQKLLFAMDLRSPIQKQPTLIGGDCPLISLHITKMIIQNKSPNLVLMAIIQWSAMANYRSVLCAYWAWSAPTDLVHQRNSLSICEISCVVLFFSVNIVAFHD